MINSCLHENFSGGIGDFLRGSVFLCEAAIKHNRGFSLSFNNHPLGRHISSQNDTVRREQIVDLETYDYETVSKQWHRKLQEKLEYLISKHETLNISSFYHPVLHENYKKFIPYLNSYNIPVPCANYFLKNIEFSNSVKSYVHNFLFNLNIYNDFDVMHFRLGDMDSWGNKFENIDLPHYAKQNINFSKFNHKFEKYVEIIIKNQSRHTLVISDNNSFKKYLSTLNLKNVYTMHNNSIHSSKRPSVLIHTKNEIERNDEDLFYIAVDAYVLTLSQKNYAYSVYEWGSGLSYWISKVFNKKIEVYKIC